MEPSRLRSAQRLSLLTCTLLASTAAHAVEFNVNTSDDIVDANPGDGLCVTASNNCSLRAAIQEANSLPGADSISLPANTYTLTRRVSDGTGIAGGDLDITDDLVIIGEARATTIIDADYAYRIFYIPSPVLGKSRSVSLSNLKMINGSAGGFGGAIMNGGKLNLDTVEISGSRVQKITSIPAYGGGVFSSGPISIANSIINDNNAENFGGGIAVSSALATISNSEINGNNSENGGGVYSSNSEIRFSDSSINFNSASGPIYGNTGGGIYIYDSSILVDRSNLSSNTGENGGGAIAISTWSDVSIIDSTLSLNSSPQGGAISCNGSGGWLYIIDSELASNKDTGNGGGAISSYCDLLAINGAEIRDNLAEPSYGDGGAIANYGDAKIYNSLFFRNTALRAGGAIWSQYGDVEIENSLFRENSSGKGAAYYNASGKLALKNVTVSGNSATVNGGGIYYSSSSPMDATNVTLNENSAGTSGGNIYLNSSGQANLGNSIIANAPSGGNCFGSFTSNNKNIDSDGSCGLNLAGDSQNDPALLSLNPNGGPTDTHALSTSPTSPAIDNGSSNSCPYVDQRLFPRTGLCDIGAFESGADSNVSTAPIGSVGYDATSYEVDELDTHAVIKVRRTGGTHGAISIDYYQAAGGSATGSRFSDKQDYQYTRGTLEWANGDSRTHEIRIPIRNDELQEGNETVLLSLRNPTGGVQLGTNSDVVLTIRDDDVQQGTLQFEETSYDVTEGVGQFNVQVTRTDGTHGTVSVAYATRDREATAGLDYVHTSGALTFNDGDTSASFHVSIIDDSEDEPTEMFDLILSDAQGGATLGSNDIRVSITDNDTSSGGGNPGIVQLVSTTYSAQEWGGIVSIMISRDSSDGAVSVQYASADGTATDGVDYTGGSGIVSLADGELNKQITFAIIDDSLVEGDETFIVTLSNPTGGATLGSKTQATVTIIDNDTGGGGSNPGTLGFSLSQASVAENAGSIELTVTRNGGDGSLVSVDFATSGGSAVDGSDYTSTTGTLTFGGNVASMPITIDITDDSVVESNETFTVTLSNPSNGATLGTATVTVTITNDDTSSDSGSGGGGGGSLGFLSLLLGGLLFARRRLH